jgi:hypothetical protein
MASAQDAIDPFLLVGKMYSLMWIYSDIGVANVVLTAKNP